MYQFIKCMMGKHEETATIHKEVLILIDMGLYLHKTVYSACVHCEKELSTIEDHTPQKQKRENWPLKGIFHLESGSMFVKRTMWYLGHKIYETKFKIRG